MIQGNWAQLLSPGLAKAFKEAYEDDMYGDKHLEALYKKSMMLPGTANSDINPYYEPKRVRELHVYDLGDGFLVPCQLVRDLFGR